MNTFLNPGDILLTHTPTFDIYGIDAEVLGAKVVTVSDLDGYRRDRDGLLAKVKEVQPKVTVLCNPNNPTGELLPLDYVERLVQAADHIVVIDEAYLEFAARRASLPNSRSTTTSSSSAPCPRLSAWPAAVSVTA